MRNKKNIQEVPLVYGVNVNYESEDLKKVKSLRGLRKLNIFGHLSEEDRDAAEAQVAAKLGLTTTETHPENTEGQIDTTG